MPRHQARSPPFAKRWRGNTPVRRTLIMGGTGVIDRFLDVFTRYIDSGFGLLGGEVAFIATTLIVIDVTLAALFWTWGEGDDIIARLVKKTLFVGVFAYIIGNWNAWRTSSSRALPGSASKRRAPALPRPNC
jgi:type IV secretory pathway TrbL component